MRGSSNPVFGNLSKSQQNSQFASFGAGASQAAFRSGQQQAFGQGQQAGYGQPQYAQQQYGQPGYDQQQYGQPVYGYGNQQPAATQDRPMTIDDIVTKTGITLGIIVVGAILNYFISQSNAGLGSLLTIVGAIAGFVLVMVATFGKKMDSAPITIAYAAAEGLFVGGVSFIFANVAVADGNAGMMIGQAVVATLGVFAGMLFVYKSGAIRVTPKFTRFIVAALFGVLALAIVNLVYGLITGEVGILRDGGPIAIGFSLLCIGLAAFSFLLDFDNADKLMRSGAPARYSWGIALGLAVTLVWLYVEILRLLSYFNQD